MHAGAYAPPRLHAGDETIEGLGTGVDPLSGASLLERDGVFRHFDSAEVLRCRILGAGRS